LDCVKNEDENIFIKENIISIHIEILLKQKLFIFISNPDTQTDIPNSNLESKMKISL